MPHVSLAVSASLLYSVIAFHKGSPVGSYYLQKWGDVKGRLVRVEILRNEPPKSTGAFVPKRRDFAPLKGWRDFLRFKKHKPPVGGTKRNE
ncbi:MAG TPA: hypothetical protein DEP80_07030 [Anaerolineae bacterium]|nr:MAG: hypothetical protein A2X26_08320 [Chloroflexi bacterium GWC2_49_37]HCC79343.1 hypothetical protein [Anaerolineae bacterium]